MNRNGIGIGTLKGQVQTIGSNDSSSGDQTNGEVKEEDFLGVSTAAHTVSEVKKS